MKIHEDLKPGNIFPDFELPDQDGEVIKLSELMGGWPTIIVFWRGQYWPKDVLQFAFQFKNRHFLLNDAKAVNFCDPWNGGNESDTTKPRIYRCRLPRKWWSFSAVLTVNPKKTRIQGNSVTRPLAVSLPRPLTKRVKGLEDQMSKIKLKNKQV